MKNLYYSITAAFLVLSIMAPIHICFAVKIGEKAILDAGEGVDPIIVATSISAYGELFDVLQANDLDGLADLFDQGKAFTVSRYSTVLVLKKSISGLCRVRILEIKDPSNCHAAIGWTCWLPEENLK